MLWVCIGMVFLAIAFLVDYRTLMYSAWRSTALSS
jgi:LPS O-antigen subunit length determinant protein (WzzB/FepE family)